MKLRNLHAATIHPSALLRQHRAIETDKLEEWKHGWNVGFAMGCMFTAAVVAVVMKGFL
jgi:hypothetical protein